MKCLNLKQIVGAVILVVGVVLIIMASRVEKSNFDKIKEHVSREKVHMDVETRYLVSGIAFVVVGGCMVVFLRCRKK